LAKRTRKEAPDLHAGLASALESALSREELSRAATAALLALDEAGQQRMLERLPSETAEAVRPRYAESCRIHIGQDWTLALPLVSEQRSRRRWLERLGGHVLPEVLVLLKKHAAALVPDPAGAHASNYDGCSEWMAAVHELSPEESGKLLRRWQEVHRRRRNLWNALSSRGLSVRPGPISRAEQ
jgi:plasmid maintenance system killer protein